MFMDLFSELMNAYTFVEGYELAVLNDLTVEFSSFEPCRDTFSLVKNTSGKKGICLTVEKAIAANHVHRL